MTNDQATAMLFDVHSRAFMGRMAQLGEQPASEKEAAALVDLGLALVSRDPQAMMAPGQGGYGDGPYAQIKRAFDHVLQNEELAPGFPKAAQALPDMALRGLPQTLVDGSYQAAYQLSLDPNMYEAVRIKLAEQNELMAQYQQTPAA